LSTFSPTGHPQVPAARAGEPAAPHDDDPQPGAARPAWHVLPVPAHLDITQAPRLREQLIDAISQGHHHLVADLSGVEFIDSTGFGVLVGGLKRVRGSNGQIRLASPSGSVERLLRITGLVKVFQTFPTVEEAVSAPLSEGQDG
jgi:anti-sigma B factor antagonist